MPLTKERKEEIIKDFGANENDSGSSDVQIAMLTERINDLTQHLKIHRKDFASRRGLLMLVAQRRALLDYVRRKDVDRYVSLLERLGIRR